MSTERLYRMHSGPRRAPPPAVHSQPSQPRSIKCGFE